MRRRSEEESVKLLNPYPVRAFTVYLGRTSNKVKGTAYKVSSIGLNGPVSISGDGQCVVEDDVALLHLTKAPPRTPLWIAPSQAAVTHGTNTLLYGYGRTKKTNSKSVGSLYSTNDGDWTIDTQCNLAAMIFATCVDPASPTGSAPAGGDGGAPWTISVDGTPVEALVFSGYDVAKGFGYGTGVAQPSTGAWLHSQLGIPTVAPGNIVRDPISGNAWFIDPQGYRKPIPDQATFDCLTGDGAQVFDFDAAPIAMMAARAVSAACGVNASVLIAGTGDGGWTAPNDNLTTLLRNAGYDVTKSAALPSDISGFNQVWWVDTNAPSASQQTQLVAYEKAGGNLFLTGDGACCETLNSALTTMINSMVGAGGVTAGGQGNACACTSAMAVNQTAVASLAQSPTAVSDWTVSQPGTLSGVSGSSVFSYYQPGDITTRKTIAAAWDHASVGGHGRLVVFMDINWTEQGYRATNWSAVAQNVAFFLSDLSSPPGPVVP